MAGEQRHDSSRRARGSGRRHPTAQISGLPAGECGALAEGVRDRGSGRAAHLQPGGDHEAALSAFSGFGQQRPKGEIAVGEDAAEEREQSGREGEEAHGIACG